MRPSVELLRLSPQDLAATAAAVCYGRPELREPEREATMLSGLMQLDPPHLTLAEHVRFTVEMPRPSTASLETLLMLPRPPLYRVRHGRGVALLGLNASHVRQLPNDGPSSLTLGLATLIRPLVPALLPEQGWWGGNPCMRLVPDDALTPAERRVFPSRSFLIRCSRACSHQLVRHRGISWEQRSQRYVDEGECDFIWPTLGYLPERTVFDGMAGPVEKTPRAWAGQVFNTAEESLTDWYSHLTGHYKVHREDARYLLPNAAATTLIATAPMDGWRHFLRLRGERKAQAEIRFLAHHIHRALLAELPDAVDDLTVDTAGLDAWLAEEATA